MGIVTCHRADRRLPQAVNQGPWGAMANTTLPNEHQILVLGDSSFSVSWLENRHALRCTRVTVWLVTIFAGSLQAWSSRFSINPDGNSYLDIASAYLKADWKNAINAYWSPVFSWISACCLWVLQPNPYWETTLLHFINVLALIAALRCFEFFFKELLIWRKAVEQSREDDSPLSYTIWWVLGYSVFLSSALSVLSVKIITPDVWVCVFTYLASALLLRIQGAKASWLTFAFLGLSLGAAFLTKSFYFPLSFVFLIAAWLANRNRPRGLLHVGVAVIAFVLLAGPFVLALSKAKHRITFGDTGKLAYVMMVDQIQQPLFWQGGNGTGVPRHPIREIFAHPRIYEFATPVAGSYPPLYDPSYWMEGATPRLRLKGQLRVLRQSAGTFFLIFDHQVEFATALLILLFLARKRREGLQAVRRLWLLWTPSAIACLAYSLVLVEPRYVVSFLSILWIAAFSVVAAVDRKQATRLWMAVVLAVASMTSLKLAKSMFSDLITAVSPQTNINSQIAEALRGLGISNGDKVAGVSLAANTHWARLAGVTVVAEIPLGEETNLWSASPQLQATVFHKLADIGAKLAVARDAPPSALAAGWFPLGATGYWAHRLPMRSPELPGP